MTNPPANPTATAQRVLLTGATGFVGSHVYPTLRDEGFEVVCATRHPREAAEADPSRRYAYLDMEDPASVAQALEGVSAAVYLVHSMSDSAEYAEAEARNAQNFREAAQKAQLSRIVYLGGMRPRGKPSHHLASRLETGRVLREGAVPVVELQATMVIGGGSESFRIVRDLAARLPVMLLPRWLSSMSEPVAIGDVAAAIAHALVMPLKASAVFAAPGPERMSGREIILRTARLLGQEPRVISVPFVTPRLSSYWIRLVTRANPQIAGQLVEGLLNDIVSEGPQIWESMRGYARTPFDEAARLALAEEASGLSVGTRAVERVLRSVGREAPNGEGRITAPPVPAERHV